MTPAMDREARRRLAGLCPKAVRVILAASRRPKRTAALRRHAKIGPLQQLRGLSGLLDRDPKGVHLSPLGVLVKRAAGGRTGAEQ